MLADANLSVLVFGQVLYESLRVTTVGNLRTVLGRYGKSVDPFSHTPVYSHMVNGHLVVNGTAPSVAVRKSGGYWTNCAAVIAPSAVQLERPIVVRTQQGTGASLRAICKYLTAIRQSQLPCRARTEAVPV